MNISLTVVGNYCCSAFDCATQTMKATLGNFY